MNEQILNAVVKLLEQGGSAAIWMWGAYLFCSLFKFLIGFGTLAYAIMSVKKAIFKTLEVAKDVEK